MTREVKTHLVDDGASSAVLTPKHLTKQEFGRRLYKLMLDRGWNQSELGRRAELPRDAISVYIRGKSLPSPLNLAALARAFGVPETDLLPNQAESAMDEEHPAFELRASAGNANLAWLRVNRLVTFSTGLKIAELLEQDNAADGKRGG